MNASHAPQQPRSHIVPDHSQSGSYQYHELPQAVKPEIGLDTQKKLELMSENLETVRGLIENELVALLKMEVDNSFKDEATYRIYCDSLRELMLEKSCLESLMVLPELDLRFLIEATERSLAKGLYFSTAEMRAVLEKATEQVGDAVHKTSQDLAPVENKMAFHKLHPDPRINEKEEANYLAKTNVLKALTAQQEVLSSIEEDSAGNDAIPEKIVAMLQRVNERKWSAARREMAVKKVKARLEENTDPDSWDEGRVVSHVREVAAKLIN